MNDRLAVGRTSTAVDSTAVDLRSQRRERLAARFPGQWVAVSSDWSQVYAHGPSYLTVCGDARVVSARDPLVTRFGSAGAL